MLLLNTCVGDIEASSPTLLRGRGRTDTLVY